MCVLHSLESHCVCTAQSREALCVTAQSREALCVCTAQSRELYLCICWIIKCFKGQSILIQA